MFRDEEDFIIVAPVAYTAITGFSITTQTIFFFLMEE
jgi:hypothetical protein